MASLMLGPQSTPNGMRKLAKMPQLFYNLTESAIAVVHLSPLWRLEVMSVTF